MSVKISDIRARQILDSRGNPTVEADIILSDGSVGRASVPSGASTGSREAIELRDNSNVYGGKGVVTAVVNINTEIRNQLVGLDPSKQRKIDEAMIAMDATENKSRLGANAILAVSLAVAKAAAASCNQPLYRYVAKLAGTTSEMSLPLPMMNVINGGQHASGSTDIQEFMIVPRGAESFPEALEMGVNIFHQLARELAEKGYATNVGDEGGYAPRFKNGNPEALDFIAIATEKAGYKLGSEVVVALDVAASELLANDEYLLKTELTSKSPKEMIGWYKQLVERYPIVSIEDGLDENDWPNWVKLYNELGGQLQLVGDDLLVTNVKLLEKAIKQHAANAILVKPNQIGTLSETIDAVLVAKKAGWRTVMSHRSGETEDTTIAHLAVGLGTGQIKTGSLSRSDRMAKYNELLRIAELEPSLNLAKPFTM